MGVKFFTDWKIISLTIQLHYDCDDVEHKVFFSFCPMASYFALLLGSTRNYKV